MALIVFVLKVLIPLEALAFVLTAVVGVFGTAQVLERIGALSAGIFEGAFYLASGFLILGVLLAGAVTFWNLIRRLGGEKKPPPLLLRWPWFLFGVFLALYCRASLPEGLGRSARPALDGALVLATALWALGYAAYLLFAIGKGGVSLSWRIARASPFGAGLLTLACLGSTAFVLTLGAIAEELQSSTRRLSASRASAPCGSLSMECSRQFLLASGGSGAGSRSLASAGTTRAPGGLRDCLESRYQDRTTLQKAHRIAQYRVGAADAWDVVHATLLSVCLQDRPYLDFNQFFLRSVENSALNWQRRQARSCSIDLTPEPACDLSPDDDYVRAETQHAVHKSLCAIGEDHRQVLFMRYFDELSELEISERLGIEYAAARKRVQRARDKMEIEFLQRCR